MTIACRSVKVHQVPSQLNKQHTEDLIQSIQRNSEFERPRFVLDFSKVKTIDERGMFLLLASLEEAMKCNGDVRLAGLHPQVASRLLESGISSLFEAFATAESAVRSFNGRSNSSATLTSEEFTQTRELSVA
jgi:anti-anti-sigma regulatory factor